jgi:alkylhydroperoxidase/carboxymuconolactone decarboxylase family protein YurZ
MSADLKKSFVETHGYWTPALETILDVSPAYFRVYAKLLGTPVGSRGLAAKVREFIGIAVNGSVTHLNEAAVRVHVEGAVREGASKAEVSQVCQIASSMGTHTMSWGIPILIEELQSAGVEISSGPLSDDQKKIRADFREKRGFWTDSHDWILRLAPHYLDAYKDFTAHWSDGPLDPKIREFVIIACDVSTTHLYGSGARIHIRNALKHGATVAELADVFVITSLIGLQTSDMSFPVIAKLFEKTVSP